MRNLVAGIKENELGSLSMEVANRADRISEILGKIDAYFERLPDCYQGPPCKEIMARREEIKRNYPVIKKNIVSYSNDLAAVVRKMREGDKAMARLFQRSTTDVDRLKRATDPNQLLSSK